MVTKTTIDGQRQIWGPKIVFQQPARASRVDRLHEYPLPWEPREGAAPRRLDSLPCGPVSSRSAGDHSTPTPSPRLLTTRRREVPIMGRTCPVAHHCGGSGGRGHRRDLHLAAAVCSQISTRRLAIDSMHEKNEFGTKYIPWMATQQNNRYQQWARAAVVSDRPFAKGSGRDEHVVDTTEACKDLPDGALIGDSHR